MISVYTKTGDKGESGLANGVRLSKADPIFDVLGTLDELNAHLGLCVTSAQSEHFLTAIQDTLFHVGAEIAGSHKTRLDAAQTIRLEQEIDRLQTAMGDEWYQKFLLPGGCIASAHLDIARTVCRRAERLLFTYAQDHSVSEVILHYLNRLSDYLYVLRCFENLQANVDEVIFDARGSYTKKLHTDLEKKTS